jgi:hypothetical protein
MNREEIEKKAVEMFPDTGFHGIHEEKRKAYIEGALMVVERVELDAKWNELSESNLDTLLTYWGVCNSFIPTTNETSATKCMTCGREMIEHEPTK